MRIVGGKFRGHALTGPKKQGTRPTSDRVREAIFNILDHGIADFSIEDKRVLDLFAGTGALGFEALSRGARFCHFVDESTEARGLIRTNADKLGVIGQSKIWRRDASRLGICASLTPFGLVFADPPYDKGLADQALLSLAIGGWLEPGAVLVLEEAERAKILPVPALTLIDRRIYGDTAVYFHRLN